MIVILDVHRSNGRKVTDSVMVPEQDETSAVCRALDAAVLAYPGAKSIRWDSVAKSESCDDIYWIGNPE
jgi:hypothetical protein